MHVQELPEAIEDAKVQLHNTNVQEFGRICRNNKAISVEDTRTLRESHIDLADHLLTVLSCTKDKDIIKKLGRLVDKVQDHAMTLLSIHAYRSGDNTKDKTYHPLKKRKL